MYDDNIQKQVKERNMIYTNCLAKAITLDYTAKVLEVKQDKVLVESKQGVLGIDCVEFKRRFIYARKQRAKTLIVTKIDSLSYLVSNQSKGTNYTVVLSENKVACQCHDYRNQVSVMGKGVCKHGYAVLALLGYKGLKHYLECEQMERQYLDYLERQEYYHLKDYKY